MDPLLITTRVDLSGANQLATGIESAMARVVQAQMRARGDVSALKDAYATLGPSAQQGSAQAVAAIAEHEAAVRASTAELTAAKAAVDALASSEERETGVLVQNISARQAATASISIAEGRLMGSNRAAGAFLATTLGLGPALQAAFPVIGAIALLEVLIHIGSAIEDATNALVGWDKEAQKAYENDEKANRQRIEKLVELKLGETELGVVSKEGAAKARAEVEKWANQEKILQQAIADTGKVTATVNAEIAELERRQTESRKEHLSALRAALGDSSAVREALAGPSAPIAQVDATETLETLKKKQQELTQEVTKYQEKLEQIQKLRKPEAEAAVPRASAIDQASLAKQLEDITVASYERQKAAAHLYYEQGIIDAQQWAEKETTADLAAIAAHQQYYSTAISLFRGAGDARKTAALESEKQKYIDTELAKTTNELANSTAALNKTLLEYQGEVIKASESTKAEDADLKNITTSTLAWLSAAKESEKAQRDLAEAGRRYDYAERAEQIQIAAARIFSSEDQTREQLKVLYKQEYDDAVEQATKRGAGEVAAIEERQSEIARIQGISGGSGDEQAARQARLTELRAELAQEQAAYQSSQGQILSAAQQFNQQMAQLTIAAIKQEENELNTFVTQGTASFNNFLVTISTTTGVVNNRVNELRFIGVQWRTMVFQMEKDFLSTILKMVEDTALFQAIQNKIQSTFAGIFGALHLGPGAHGSAASAAASSPQVANTAALQTSNASLISNTSAITANTAAINATVAKGLAGAAGAVSPVAQGSQTVATTANTVSTTANTAVTGVNTTAMSSLGALMAIGSAATVGLTAASGIASGHQQAGTAALILGAVETAAQVYAIITLAAAVTANTFALSGNTAALYVDAFTPQFDEGGVMPHTGWAILHANERVLTPEQRAEYEAGRAGGAVQGGDTGEGGHLHFHLHQGSISALDSGGVDHILARNQKAVLKSVNQLMRRGALNPRQILRHG